MTRWYARMFTGAVCDKGNILALEPNASMALTAVSAVRSDAPAPSRKGANQGLGTGRSAIESAAITAAFIKLVPRQRPHCGSRNFIGKSGFYDLLDHSPMGLLRGGTGDA
jgi:hypothetical protein